APRRSSKRPPTITIRTWSRGSPRASARRCGASISASCPRASFSRRGGCNRVVRIGVLAVQGDVIEHRTILRGLGVAEVEVRLPGDLVGVDGLILPGGESTTIGKLMVRYGMGRTITEQVGRELVDKGNVVVMRLIAM